MVLSLNDLTEDYNEGDEWSEQKSPGFISIVLSVLLHGRSLTNEHRTGSIAHYHVPGDPCSPDDAVVLHVQPRCTPE